MPPRRLIHQTPAEREAESELAAYGLHLAKGVDESIQYITERFRETPEQHSLHLERLYGVCYWQPLDTYIDSIDILIKQQEDQLSLKPGAYDAYMACVIARADVVLNRQAIGFAKDSLSLLRSAWDRNVKNGSDESHNVPIRDRISKLETAFSLSP